MTSEFLSTSISGGRKENKQFVPSFLSKQLHTEPKEFQFIVSPI